VAGRKETASEWHEVTVSVRVPEESSRALVSAVISPTHLEVTVAAPAPAPPLLVWRRRLQQRTLKYEDGHTSRTHVDTANSTWLLGTDAEGSKCVQFVLAQWMEGANKNQEEKISNQLKGVGLSVLTEDADPHHLFELLEAEVWLRAGAVYKKRGALCEAAEKLVQEMEKHEEREGRDPAALRKSPLAEVWQEDEGEEEEEEEEEAAEGGQVAEQTGGGGEVDDAALWWAAERAAELEAWRAAVAGARAADEERRARMQLAGAESEARAAAAAAARVEAEDKEAGRRRKEVLREHQRMVAAAREAEARAGGGAVAGAATRRVEAAIGVDAMRSAAASAARANPLPPKPLCAADVASATGATGAHAEATGGAAPAPSPETSGAKGASAAGAVHSLAKCGYWFEDAGETVKVTVPLADACGASGLPSDCAAAEFSRFGARLEVRLPSGVHVLTLPELFKEILPDECELKLRYKTRRAVLVMKKRLGGVWVKLAAA